MALDEATAQLLAQMANSGGKPLHEMDVAEARAMVGQMSALGGHGPEMAEERRTRVRVAGGHVPILVLKPSPQPVGVIVYYHGGGWVLGDIDGFEALGRHLASRTDCTVCLVDYRLAPEYRFPTAADDAWAALLWTDARRGELARDAAPLIVAGDSAGGNLAAVVSLRAKAARGPAIALQVLIYPVTDCDVDTTSYIQPENQLMLTREAMIWFWDHYAPVPTSRLHPDASPLRAPDLTGLPPALVLTAEHDVLRNEGELYATRLIKAGVPVRQRRFEGQMHGFFTMVGILPGSEAGMDFVAEGVHATLAAASLATSGAGAAN